ncbi:MAG: hypothetical protein R3E94_03660 [Burkholderiaceae bacterium]
MSIVQEKWYPEPGRNCPREADLQTGDLLFPRKPGHLSGQALGWGSHWAEMLGAGSGAFQERMNVRIGTLLKNSEAAAFVRWLEQGDDAKRWISGGYAPDPTRLAVRTRPTGAALMALGTNRPDEPSYTSLLLDAEAGDHPLSGARSTPMVGGFPGPDDPDFLIAMKAILDIALPGIIKDWLGMTVADFIRHEVGRFLVDALTSPDVRLSFFVGHVGIVLRELDGRSVDPPHGRVRVIETNITDYAHYRVSIQPYFDADDIRPHNATEDEVAKEAAHKMRGWVNRRCALGEQVWMARPDPSTTPDWQDRLLQAGKSYLGRPYGFFDHPCFGDDDRMYCAEYVFRVFKDVDPVLASGLQDRRNWGDMKTYLDRSGQAKQHKLVEDIQRQQGFPDGKPFFVLPPALLWNSTALQQKFAPDYGACDPYAVAI